MAWMAADGNDGWTEPSGPLVNEMLLHDVYDLPWEVRREMPRQGSFAGAFCPDCGATGDRFEPIRHESGCPRREIRPS